MYREDPYVRFSLTEVTGSEPKVRANILSSEVRESVVTSGSSDDVRESVVTSGSSDDVRESVEVLNVGGLRLLNL